MKLKLNRLFSQRDSKWKNTLLGYNTNSEYTIGSYGCRITEITMYLSALGKDTDVAKFHQDLLNLPKATNNKVYAFVNGGYFVPGSLKSLYPDMSILYTSPRFSDKLTNQDLQKMRDFLDQGYYLHIEVDSNPSQIGQQQHWVGGYGYDGDDFYIVDPWTGESVNLSVYGDPAVSIYSYMVYSPKLEKEDGDEDEDKLTKCEENKDYWKAQAKEARTESNKRAEELKKKSVELVEQKKEYETSLEKKDVDTANKIKEMTEDLKSKLVKADQKILELEKKLEGIPTTWDKLITPLSELIVNVNQLVIKLKDKVWK